MLTRSREDAEGLEAQKGKKSTKKMECVRGREAAQWMGEWKWRE